MGCRVSAGVADLLAALVDLRDEFDCDSLAASYVTPAGALVTVSVYRTLATISDDHGNVQAIPLSEIEQ
jgi:hypothetical protein